jgi:hypothetical protein
LRGAGVAGTFTVSPRNNGTTQTPKYTVPAEQLTVTGTNPDAILGSVTALAQQFALELEDLQARVGVRAAYRITAQQLVAPTVSPLRGSKIRGLFGVAVLGATATVMVPNWFERIVRRRARRTAATRSERIVAA